jgi:hypothetical protein
MSRTEPATPSAAAGRASMAVIRSERSPELGAHLLSPLTLVATAAFIAAIVLDLSSSQL